MTKFRLELPYAAKLSAPIDFCWADTRGPRDVSSYDGELVAFFATPLVKALRQDGAVTSRKYLDAVAADFPAKGAVWAEIRLKVGADVVDRVFGTVMVAGTPATP